MLTRRDAIRRGVSLGLAAVPLGTSMTNAGETVSLHTFVYDNRFASGRRCGTQAAQAGCPVSPITGDVTRLWVDDLSRRWKHARVPIAGVTTERSWFCLDLMARGYTMRTVVRRNVSGINAYDFDALADRIGLAVSISLARERVADTPMWRGPLDLQSQAEETLMFWMIAPLRAV